MRLQVFTTACAIFLAMQRTSGSDITDSNESSISEAEALEEGIFEREFPDTRHTEDFDALERRKRALPTYLLKILAEQGAEAVKRLLSGAKKVKTQPSDPWLYAKRGDFDTAYWDLRHVIDQSSMKTRHIPGTDNDLITGRAGDKALALLARHSDFKNNPTIEVHDVFDNKVYGKIVYVKAKKDM